MEPQNNPTTSRWAGLKDRVVSGAILAIVAICVVSVGGLLFNIIAIAAALQMLREWDSLTLNENRRWKLSGVLYCAIPCACLIWLRDNGATPVLFVILVVCATDIGAYFTGREIGGPKLAPALSPSKTWAGLGGGMVAAALVATICSSFAPYPASAPVAFVLGGILAALSQGGDLFESWLKRRAGVKDSGNLIPGHGGLLDRVDGLVAAIPVYALLFWIAGNLS
jgi:phosphatidate cytidylyltransferase